MTFKDYQTQAIQTALPTSRTPEYMILGLCNEAGEVAGKWKKRLRDGNIDMQAMEAELGDVLWYIAGTATELGLDLESVAQSNLMKLQSRKARNVLAGSGDNR